MHPKDGDQYPIGSRVFSKKKNKKGTIVDHGFVKDNVSFLNYYIRYDGEISVFPAYHDDLFLISKPT